MKKYGKYLIAAVAGLVFFAACDNYEADDHKFGNAVYLDVAETNEVQLTTFGNNKPTYDCALQAELTYPAGQEDVYKRQIPARGSNTLPCSRKISAK